jgi:hypothetical protein
MKTVFVLALCALVVTGCTQHQSSNRGAGLSDQGVSTGEGLSPDGYAVSERRQRGRVRFETNSYTEIEPECMFCGTAPGCILAYLGNFERDGDDVQTKTLKIALGNDTELLRIVWNRFCAVSFPIQ